MKQLYLLLLMACHAHDLWSMTRTQETFVLQSTLRCLKIQEQYAKLRVDLISFNRLSSEQQAGYREAFLKKMDEGFKVITDLEADHTLQNNVEYANRVHFFRRALKSGEIDLEAFEKIVRLGAGSAPTSAGQAERKRDADAEQSASANADRADDKRGAAQRAEVQSQDDKKRQNAERQGAAQQPRGTPDDANSSDPGFFRVVGEMGATGVASRAAWVLAGSNPYVAGALAAREVYRAGKFFLWMAEEGEKIQAAEAKKKAEEAKRNAGQ